MKRCIYVLVAVALTVITRQGRATDCSWCVLDTCSTTYTTYDDFDMDGMTDAVESTLAVQYKPILYLDNANADRPCKMPNHYEVPPYSYNWGPNHGLPEDVVSDGTVYYRVRPFGIVEPGRCYYIEIDYWFYYTYNQAECHAGYWTEHGHDWEHIALGLIGTPSHRKVTKIYYSIHESGQYVDPEDAQWVGVPQESGVKVFIENGSHASYPSTGEKCSEWFLDNCLCWETVNGQYEFQVENSKLIPLYEVNDTSRAPGWLDYPIRWPGYTGHIPFPINEDFPPPFGPAKGDHESAWLIGHFSGVIPYCYKTNLEEVPFPKNFEVSNFKNSQQLNNALYLTWSDPDGGPQTGFALMRKPYYAGNDQYTCIAELPPSQHDYIDSCLDGQTGWFYKLETYKYSADPSHKGCSLPTNTVKDGWVAGEDPCPGSLVPARPTLLSCDNCVLRWWDMSDNETGFHIWLNNSIVGTAAANDTSFTVSNCNTGKTGYKLGAFNEYGETYAVAHVPCNGGESGCPFIYTWNGSDYVKDNNLLAASEDSTLSKVNMSGFYLLTQPLVPQSNQYKLQIREFEREHSFFDYLSLITLDHPADKKIALTLSGKPYSYSNPRPPISCVDNRGFDCLAQIADEDSLYYKNDQPGFMVINFGVLSNVTGLYKPLTTGPGTGVPEQPKEDTPNKLTPLTSNVNGNVLKVEVFQDTIWIPVGKLYPHSKPSIRLIELASFIKPQTELKLKLSWNRRYSANQIALYDLESSSLVLHNLNLSSAANLSSGDIKAKLSQMDNNFAELIPVETIELTFPYFPADSNMQRDFIVAAKGYYYSEDYVGQYSTQWLSDTATSLQQNYPNPFNPETQIKFVLPKSARVKLEVYNLLGQKVVTLIDKEMAAGYNTVVWDGKNETGENVSSGIYFYRLEAGDLKETKKMVIVR